jgi:hypothetical protein
MIIANRHKRRLRDAASKRFFLDAPPRSATEIEAKAEEHEKAAQVALDERDIYAAYNHLAIKRALLWTIRKAF